MEKRKLNTDKDATLSHQQTSNDKYVFKKTAANRRKLTSNFFAWRCKVIHKKIDSREYYEEYQEVYMTNKLLNEQVFILETSSIF